MGNGFLKMQLPVKFPQLPVILIGQLGPSYAVYSRPRTQGGVSNINQQVVP